ncbi:MAG: hypothetical protein WAU81_10640 [Candidatus Aminicenantales bacterium]
MLGKKVGRHLIGVLMILVLAAPAAAQLIDIGKFKGVQIPYTLKFQDKVLEKGRYDLETLKNPDTPSCYLRFKKGGKVMCLVEGERLEYKAHGMSRMTDSEIPNKPRLKMKRNTEEKVLIFMVETGRDSLFPYLLLRFKLEYEE